MNTVACHTPSGDPPEVVTIIYYEPVAVVTVMDILNELTRQGLLPDERDDAYGVWEAVVLAVSGTEGGAEYIRDCLSEMVGELASLVQAQVAAQREQAEHHAANMERKGREEDAYSRGYGSHAEYQRSLRGWRTLGDG